MPRTVFAKRKTPAQQKRSDAARKRVHSGERAEQIVAKLNDQCAEAGVAWIRKLPTPWKVIRQTRAGLLVAPVKKSGVDYMGHMRDGRAVYMEVKYVEGKYFDPKLIKPWQKDELDRAQASGAVALVVIVWKGSLWERVFVVPWNWVCTVKATETFYLNFWCATAMPDGAITTTGSTYLHEIPLKPSEPAP